MLMMRAPFVEDHRGKCQSRSVEGRAEIDGNDRVPFGRRKLVQGGDVLNACVVDQDVEPAEFMQRCRNHLGDRFRIRHIGAGIADTHAEILGDAVSHRFDLFRLAEAVQHDVRACAGESPRDAEPDAAGRAGNERNLILQRLGGSGLALHHGDIHSLALLAWGARGDTLKVPGPCAQGYVSGKCHLAKTSIGGRYQGTEIRGQKSEKRAVPATALSDF
jgi:hypothetical protein